MNWVIYDVMLMIGKSGELFLLFLIGEGKDVINLLYDFRVVEIFCRFDME